MEKRAFRYGNVQVDASRRLLCAAGFGYFLPPEAISIGKKYNSSKGGVTHDAVTHVSAHGW